MGTVRDILNSKGNTTFSITPGTTVYHALEIMFEKNVSSLVILDDGRLAGIFTERDYCRKIALKGRSSRETLVGEIMTEKVITVTPESTIDRCMQVMTENFIRHIPVWENDKLMGIVSIGDLVKFIIQEQKFIIDNMQQYISRT